MWSPLGKEMDLLGMTGGKADYLLLPRGGTGGTTLFRRIYPVPWKGLQNLTLKGPLHNNSQCQHAGD